MHINNLADTDTSRPDLKFYVDLLSKLFIRISAPLWVESPYCRFLRSHVLVLRWCWIGYSSLKLYEKLREKLIIVQLRLWTVYSFNVVWWGSNNIMLIISKVSCLRKVALDCLELYSLQNFLICCKYCFVILNLIISAFPVESNMLFNEVSWQILCTFDICPYFAVPPLILILFQAV